MVHDLGLPIVIILPKQNASSWLPLIGNGGTPAPLLPYSNNFLETPLTKQVLLPMDHLQLKITPSLSIEKYPPRPLLRHDS